MTSPLVPDGRRSPDAALALNFETIRAPLAVVMISFNEAHNMRAVLQNIGSFAQQIFLVDSYSTDSTVDIALGHGVHVVQRRFRGFGDQWNFALGSLPIASPWTMKLDPDERLTDELKASIRDAIADGQADGLVIRRRLWFMGQRMPVRQNILRVWRTGACKFSDVLVNEHPLVVGRIARVRGDLEHHDSPNLHHWFDKQNNYTTAEAFMSWTGQSGTERESIATAFGRRMWLKRNFTRVPFKSLIMQFYCIVFLGAWRAGRVGFLWARLRGDVYRFRSYKLEEMIKRQTSYNVPVRAVGLPHPEVKDFDGEDASGPSWRGAPNRAAASIVSVAYHDMLAPGWDERYEQGGFKLRAKFIESTILSRVRLSGSWLDVGCGSGYFTRMLRERGASVLGIDGSKKMIESAQRAPVVVGGPNSLEYSLVPNVESLSYSDESYDGAICLSVLEYLGHPETCVFEIVRVLRTGGYIIVSVPNKRSLLRAGQTALRGLLSVFGRSPFSYLGASKHSWTKSELVEMFARQSVVLESVIAFDPVIPMSLHPLFGPSMYFLVGRKAASRSGVGSIDR